MYEAARVTDTSTASRLAATAARSGYDGLVVRNGREAGVDADRLREACGIDVVRGAEVVADDPSSARGHVGNYRPDHDLVSVRGGSVALNRFAVETPAVDVLARPMRDDGDFNHVLARAAADNGVRVEFALGPVLRTDGGPRVRAIGALRKLYDLVTTYDAPHVVSADADTHLELRAPRELAAVGETVGLDREFVCEGLREWGRLVARNREHRDDAHVAPGVRRVTRDPEDGGEDGNDDLDAGGDAP